MSNQLLAVITRLATVVVASLLLLRPAVAQRWVAESACPDNAPAVFHSCAMELARSFDPPRTLDGRPDLGGMWRLPFGDAEGAYEDLEEHPGGLDDLGGPTAIVDPPDGKIPMQAWAVARREENPVTYIHHNAACFLSGVPNTMYHGEEHQFLQTNELLVVLSGNAHGYRIIPLDGRPPVGENIRLWDGASGGRWEGNTLVIETTNLNGKSWLDQGGTFYTEDMRVVERLTLIEPDTIHYEATIDDPNVYTRPFTVAFPYRRNAVAGYEIPESACYENNEALLEIYRTIGFEIYPGVTVEEAREASEAQQ